MCNYSEHSFFGETNNIIIIVRCKGLFWATPGIFNDTYNAFDMSTESLSYDFIIFPRIKIFFILVETIP